jgi:hypothetical protein
MTTIAQIDLPMEKIAEFCHKWQVTELALFGSILRDDFNADLLPIVPGQSSI